MKIRILGAHNSESQTSRCACILIDDTLVMDAGGLTSSLCAQEQQKLKAVLLSHHHYDHIRDIPGLALNLNQQGANICIYSSPDVQAIIETRLLDGKLYPKFQDMPRAKPTVRFKSITPYQSRQIDGHRVIALPVHHNGNTLGFMVRDAAGKTVFYTADTGPNLRDCWDHISPQLLIIDVTFADRQKDFALSAGHLTPSLLHEELAAFRDCKGYLPDVIAVHMDPSSEPAIKKEIARVAKALGASIKVAHEGMEVNI